MKTQSTTRLSRAWVASLRRAGMSARDISSVTGISLNTIYRWLRKWREDGLVERLLYYRMSHQSVMVNETAEATNVHLVSSRTNDSVPHTFKPAMKVNTDYKFMTFYDDPFLKSNEHKKHSIASAYMKMFWLLSNNPNKHYWI